MIRFQKICSTDMTIFSSVIEAICYTTFVVSGREKNSTMHSFFKWSSKIYDACCISATHISVPKKMFNLLHNKIFTFITTLNIFIAEIGIAEIRRASKISPPSSLQVIKSADFYATVILSWGCIFSCVWPLYEWVVSNLSP
jgi:hypothetical protein